MTACRALLLVCLLAFPLRAIARASETKTPRDVSPSGAAVQTCLGGLNMKIVEIPLTQGQVAIIEEADSQLVKGFQWFAAKCPHTFYAVAWDRGTKPLRGLKMHRILLGVSDLKIEVDHRDGNGLNNVRSNLRVADRVTNSRNRAKRIGCSSRFKGVACRREKLTNQWRAYICVRAGKLIHLGEFATEVEAARAYDAAALELFGEFARLNFQSAGGAA